MKPCKYCGKQFDNFPKNKIYCNGACNWKASYWRNRKKIIENNHQKTIEKYLKREDTFCKYCGKMLKKLRHPNRIYCNNKCRKEFLKTHFIHPKIIIPKEILYKKYIIEEFSCKDISKEYGCSLTTIASTLKKYKIPTRITGIHPHTKRSIQKCKESRKKQEGENHPRLGAILSKEQIIKTINTKRKNGTMPVGEKNPMWGKHHSIETIEKIKKNHIEKGISVLEKNPNWKGGLTFEPYDKKFNSKFKEMIRERDGNLCLRCGMSKEDSKIKYKQDLHIHHIDYNKMNTSKDNCCSLCCKCNILANYNRNRWTAFYRTILNFLYGYEYENAPTLLEIPLKIYNLHKK